MSKPPTPFLTIVDVGHGNAAVLRDPSGVVVFDAGRGQHLRRFLRGNGITEIDALLLSHADADHYCGAISLLRDRDFLIHQVFLNPDPTKKDKDSHKQLRLAVVEAGRKRGTTTETQLTTALTGRLDRGAVRIEVLHPPPELSMSGVAGEDLDGNTLTSNALSAAIRVSHEGTPLVLLGGDIQFVCLRNWAERDVEAAARVLVFPHHGGSPGNCNPADASVFAHEVAQHVKPEVVAFSIHRTRYGLPREDVLDALEDALEGVRFLCTQLPRRISDVILSTTPGPWVLHRKEEGGEITCIEGDIHVMFCRGGYEIRFANA